ncbi:MAG: hypothetical protein KDB22_02900, partial [Planctomycetales bacterium]|nr:hypothetical protein [Planctomycetales bacterium]
MRSFVTFFTLLVTSPCLWAQLPTIEFAGVTQPVVQKNTQVQLEVTGTFVDEPAELLFSDSALQAVAVPPSTAPFEEAKSSARFGLRVPTEVPSGLHQVRMRGRFGVSNPRPLLVVDKPVEIAQIPQSANAPLRTDCIYFGHFAPRDRVSFSVQLSPGEVFSCRAYTTQLDSQAIPAMALYDPSAGEICRARGIEDWPAEFSWTAQVAGSYTVVLHDFLYRGGNEFAFVLEGIVTSPESATQVSIDKWLRPSSRRKVTSCRELALNEDERATVSGSTAQAQNTSDTQTYQVPFAVAGNLQSGIPNQFDFEVKAGQQLRLDVCSQELGRLTDPRLYLFQHPATGETAGTMPLLSERDDEPGFGGPELLLPSKDPSLDWHAPQDGIYRVAVLDNESGQRPVDSTEFILRVSPPRPDFELFAYRPFPTNNPAGARPMGSNLLRGGTEVVRLLVNRKHGYAGPIDIEVLGLPDQITCSALSIPPDANSGVLILAAAEDAPAWCGSLSIVGKGATQSRLIERNAQPHAVSAKASAEMNRVHSRACDDLVILVNDNDVAPLS